MPQQPTPISARTAQFYELIKDMGRPELPLTLEDCLALEEEGFKAVEAQNAINELLEKGYLNQIKLYSIGWLLPAGRSRFNG